MTREGPLPQAEEARAGSEAAARTERMKQRTPRVDGAELLKRTFDLDVFACGRCGGRRRVLAYVKEAGGVRAILEHLGQPTIGARLAPRRLRRLSTGRQHSSGGSVTGPPQHLCSSPPPPQRTHPSYG